MGEKFHVRVQLPLGPDPDSEPEPDVAAVLGARLDFTDEHPTSAALVIEVADTTLRFDRVVKAAVYARAGIEDYWIVNLVDGIVEVYRDPGPDAASPIGHGYRQRRTFGSGTSITPVAFPDVVVAVRDLLPKRR